MAAPSVVDIKVPLVDESNRFHEVKFKPAIKSLDNHSSSQTMRKAVLNKSFHTFPSLGNVFIIQLPKIHNVTSQLDILAGG